MKYKFMTAVLALFMLVPTMSVSAQTNEAAGIIIESGQADGTSFQVEVYANTGGEEVNAVEFTVEYSESTLRFDSFDSSDSDFGIEAPNATGSNGAAIMSRASIEPRNSDRSLITIMNFTPIAEGSITLTIGQDSRLLRFTDSENIIGTVQQIDAAVTQGNTGLEATSVTVTEQVVEAPIASFSQDAGVSQNTDDDSVSVGDSASVGSTNEQAAASSDGQQISETGEGDESNNSQVVVGGVALLGLLLIVFAYAYTRLNNRGNVPMHEAGHVTADHAPRVSVDPGTEQRPVASHTANAPVHQIQPTQSASNADSTVAANELDELLSEVHGSDAKNADVISPKKIDIS